MKESFFKVLY